MCHPFNNWQQSYSDLIMMHDINAHECSSVQEDQLDILQKEALVMEGPSLSNFPFKCQSNQITSFSAADIVNSLPEQDGKEVLLIGSTEKAYLRAFSYILLLVGLEERRNYPHLNTLIRQQFYKPNIFYCKQSNFTDTQTKEMLQLCLRYFQQVSQGNKIEEYINRYPLFEKACCLMLQNSIQQKKFESHTYQSKVSSVYMHLAKKFNIDINSITTDLNCECYQLGRRDRFYILREHQHYFIVMLGMDRKDRQLTVNNDSKMENQSERQADLHVIIEASDQSTPKFKNGSVKHRKKSHKNSFGGDMQIVHYRDLINKDPKRQPKVLSQYFDDHQNSSVFLQNVEHSQQPKKNHTFNEIITPQNGQVTQNVMKGSNIDAILPQRRKLNKDRKISSSQIIQHRQFGNALLFAKNQRQKQKYQKKTALNQQDIKLMELGLLSDIKPENQSMRGIKSSIIANAELERIQERQSSQKQSTHPDQSSELTSDAIIELLDGSVQAKMKDRKYSYFTQQMASSTKNKRQVEADKNSYAFRAAKNHNHKNSEVIAPSGGFGLPRRRFQENPLRFSQLKSPSQQSVKNTSVEKNNKFSQNKKSRKLQSGVFSYQIMFEPSDWLKKQVVYHFDHRNPQMVVYVKSQKEGQRKVYGSNYANEMLSMYGAHSTSIMQTLPVFQGSSSDNIPQLRASKNFSGSISISKQPSQTAYSLQQGAPPSIENTAYDRHSQAFIKHKVKIHSIESQTSLSGHEQRQPQRIKSKTKVSFNYINGSHPLNEQRGSHQQRSQQHIKYPINMPIQSRNPYYY